MIDSIFAGLNSKQIAAIQQLQGATLVVAGAGSGKTTVLTRRVAYLIACGVTPGHILCLTFTNKAAQEMSQRVRQLLSTLKIHLPEVPPWKEDYLSTPLLCTFHSLGARLLREFGERLGLKKEFTILDSDDQKQVAREILKELNLDPKIHQPGSFTYFVSQCKQELLTAADSQKLSKEFPPIFHQFYRKYEQRLHANQAVDFDDLLLLPYLLLQEHSDILQTLQERWRHVMVDEFQDTNLAQFELIKQLAPKEMLSSD